jgi:antagonist of KipI
VTGAGSGAAIVVESPGLFTTVQDLGRPGHARLGISAAGAADPLALRLANRLAGNPEGTAALEMTLAGGTFRFEADAVVAIAGAEMEARAESDAGGLSVPAGCAAFVPAGGRLRCGAARQGARAMLAVAGGLRVPAWLGSVSTHAGSRLGGVEGRALVKGDRLPFAPAMAAAAAGGAGIAAAGRPAILRRLEGEHPAVPAGAMPVVLRVTAGAQWDRFDTGGRASFTAAEYVVSGASDRMGLRLDGAPIAPPGAGRMLTEGMPLGAVQIPPAGKPVILFVDHQTTGGYPVIASIVSADLPRVGQLRPGARLRFELVDLEAAFRLLHEQEARLAALRLVPA